MSSPFCKLGFLGYVRQQCQLGFHNLQFPINLFHQMMSLVPRPSVIDFNRLFAAMLKLKRLQPHATVIALYSHLDISGARPDSYSIGILANCYCHLGRIDFGYSLLAKSLKLGYPFESDCVLLTTLINGLVHNNQLPQAVELFDLAVVKLGMKPHIVTYGTMVKGLCGIGDNAGALHLLRQMNSLPFSEPVVQKGYSSLLSFTVTDITDTVMKLIELGAELDGPIKHETHGKDAAVCLDGHVVGLYEPV